jgi:hypothetical protein
VGEDAEDEFAVSGCGVTDGQRRVEVLLVLVEAILDMPALVVKRLRKAVPYMARR